MATSTHTKKDFTRIARDLAADLRLLESSDKLPRDVDISPKENGSVQLRIRALETLPREVRDGVYVAFSAHHLPALADALRDMNGTQLEAITNLVQILSLLPEPRANPYLRRFLRNTEAMDRIPSFLAMTLSGLIPHYVKEPSTLGHIFGMFIHILQWCDPSMGHDSLAPIHPQPRQMLLDRINELTSHSVWKDASELDQAGARSLVMILEECQKDKPGKEKGYYLRTMRVQDCEVLWGGVPEGGLGEA